MKKITFLSVMIFVYAFAASAENWQNMLKKQNISTVCGKKALIIGVGNYKNADGSRLKDLNGPKNDVEMMKKDFLEPVLGYKPDEILVLTDDEVTKAAITDVMENWFLKGEAVKERFFYFSGHGSQIEDTGGDEKDDGKDEVILTYNAEYDADDSLKKETVVIDDEIGKWFESLSGKKLVAVFDSCCSGTMSRDIGVSITVPKFVYSKGKFGETIPAKGNSGLTEDFVPENHFYFYASQSSQPAEDKMFETGRYQGVLTTAMTDAVKKICAEANSGTFPKNVSYMELFTAVHTIIKNEWNMTQTPDIQPVFRGENPAKYKGTPSARLFDPFFTVSKSAASLKTCLPDADRHKIRVLLMQEPGKKTLVPSELSGSARYGVVDFSQKEKTYHLYINVRADSVELSNMNGELLNRFTYSGKSELVNGIEKRISHAFLKDLLEQIKSEHGFPLSVKAEHQGKLYDKNDFYCKQEITYQIESNVDAYVYVLSVDAGGELNLYLPFQYQKNNKIRKGGTIRIPDTKQCGDDFALYISNEPGEEILKIIALPTRLDINIPEEKGNAVSKMSFEETLKTVKDMIAQLKNKEVWYEGTKKYMNHTRQDYDRMFLK